MQRIVLNLNLLNHLQRNKNKNKKQNQVIIWLLKKLAILSFFFHDPKCFGFVSFLKGIVHIRRHFANFQEKYFV